MNTKIIYRPYKYHGWFVPFTMAVSILSFVVGGKSISNMGIGTLVLMSMGFLAVLLTKRLYDSSRIAIFFELKGVRITGSSYTDYRFIPWEELLYAFYARSFRGHLFLVLSPKTLSPQEIKHFINQGANSSKTYIDYVVVFPIEVSENVSQLMDLIYNNISHVDK